MASETHTSETVTPPSPGAGRSDLANGRSPAGWERPAVLAIALLYVALRALVWRGASLVEDHGSISQLFRAQAFLTLDVHRIGGLEPDTTPFYPAFLALFSLPGWSLETAARLCSLTFSLLLFYAVLQIGRRIAGREAALAGLILISLNPVLTRLGPAILTEPAYIATVYLGLWLFWRQYDRPALTDAIALGLVFGLAFLNRVEALLFLAAIPVFQLVHYVGTRPRRYDRPALAKWAVAFGVSFAAVAGPQVWWVSQQMGRLAINGRQVWSQVLVQEGKSYEEQVYGLDYSPGVINLTYLQSHPEAMPSGPASQPSLPARYFRLIVENSRELFAHKLGALLGAGACAFLLVGLASLFLRRQQADALIAIGFFAVTLTGPLLHNVVLRHIIVIAPLALLIGGLGITETAQWIARRTAVPRQAVMALALVLLGAGWAPALRQTFRGPVCNAEYCADSIHRAAQVVKTNAQGTPVVAARKQYLAYFAGGSPVPLPYTDYEGLVRYLGANGVDYLYLERWQIGSYPFMRTFEERASADFGLLDRQTDALGRTSELYRVSRKSGS